MKNWLVTILKILAVWAAVLSAILLPRCNAPSNSTENLTKARPVSVLQTSGGIKSADKLFDGDVSTAWFVGWNKADYPMRCVVDFGIPIFAKQIRYYDGTGAPMFSIRGMATPNDSMHAIHQVFYTEIEHRLDKHNVWWTQEFNLHPERTYRYVEIIVDSQEGEKMLTEVEFLVAGNTSPPADTTVTKPPCPPCPPCPPVDTTVTVPPVTDKTSALIGVNCFPWTPLEKLKSFNLRCYIDAGWIWRPGGLYINPMYQAKAQTPWGMMDEYFNECARLGIDVAPCILKTPDWFNGKSDNNGTNSNNFPPIRPGKDRKDPASYREYADFLAQFAMRYGARAFSDDKLRVDVTPRWSGDISNTKKSGLGALPIEQGGVRIKFIEVTNEVDRWWDRGGVNDAAYMHPEEYAALLVACYRAIRKVSDVGIIMGGITGLDLPYLKALFAAADKIAPGEKITDRLVVHYYNHDGNRIENGVLKWPPTWWLSGACMPSEDQGFAMIHEIVKFGNSRGLKTWVNEFGCDSRPESWMHIKGSRYGLTDEQAQSRAIVETFKAYGAAKVERAYMFMAADEHGSGLWQSCGLLTNEASGYQAKPAYAATVGLVNEIGTKTEIPKPKVAGQPIPFGVSKFKMPQK